jgi:hypothetical protein
VNWQIRPGWPRVLLLASAAACMMMIQAANQTMEIAEDGTKLAPTPEEIDEESRRIRRLCILVRLTLETIAEGALTAEEASGMIAATRRVAMEMFPGKERAFDLIYRPQFQRVMHAVYRLQ